MALHDVTRSFLRRLRTHGIRSQQSCSSQCRRWASTAVVGEQEDGTEDSSFHIRNAAPPKKAFDPVATARKRHKQLPSSRYSFRPPKYYRGSLHPHQPPPTSDPASRAYVPGPFSLPRLEQTYHDTFAPDLMTMTYQHSPPGTSPAQKGERLRSWTGDNPYFKNRPLRGPRGGDVLRLLRKPITYKNIPRLEKVTVHTMVKGAVSDSAHLHVAGMVLQAITNIRATPHATRKSVAGFGVREGLHLSLTCELRGEDMYHFLSKVVDVVLPKIKDWRGVKGSSGDSSGNLAFGLRGEQVAMFPEVEVNYDMYPPRLIPGCHIFVHTSAATDYDARLLLRSIGFPFDGKLVD